MIPFVAPDVFAAQGAEMVDFETLLKQADYLTLHCPLLDKTRNVIGREQLADDEKKCAFDQLRARRSGRRARALRMH